MASYPMKHEVPRRRGRLNSCDVQSERAACPPLSPKGWPALTLTYTPPFVPHTQKVLWLQAKDKRRPQDHCLLRRYRSQEASTTPQGCPRRCAREVLRVRQPLAGGFGGVHCAGYWFRFGSGLLRWYVFFGLVMGSEEMSRASQALRGDKGAKGERYICIWKG